MDGLFLFPAAQVSGEICHAYQENGQYNHKSNAGPPKKNSCHKHRKTGAQNRSNEKNRKLIHDDSLMVLNLS